jgi:hypothetical protein
MRSYHRGNNNQLLVKRFGKNEARNGRERM